VVVLASAVDRPDGVTDAVDGDEEVVDAGLGEGSGTLGLRQVHSMSDDRRAQSDLGGMGDYAEDGWVQRRLATHEIDELVVVVEPELL